MVLGATRWGRANELIMGKRMTETAKWSDPWFRGLEPEFKLAWNYLCDCCDVAGAIDLDRDLANYQIGKPIEWQTFLGRCGDRVERLPGGKLWITGFVEFQYGTLSETCNPHKPVIARLKKLRLWERYLKGSGTLKEQEQEQDKETEQDKNKPAPEVDFGAASLNEAVREWLAYKIERRERYKPTGLKAFLSQVRNLAEAHGADAVVAAIREAMANNWKGFTNTLQKEGRNGRNSRTPSSDSRNQTAADAGGGRIGI